MKRSQQRKKVLAFGTFDGIHPGHVFYLNEASKLGNLTVSITSDVFVKKMKSKVPKPEQSRKKDIEKLGIASKVVIGDKKFNTWSIIRGERPDVLALGYDQQKFYKMLKENYKKIGVPFKIKFIKSYKPNTYHSSLLKKKCVFCSTPEIKKRVVAENKLAWAFGTNIPIVPGHLLLIPKRCVEKFDNLTKKEVSAILDLKSKLKIALKKTFRADGFNFAWNENEVAGQTVPHFHLHILPRTKGDAGITKYEPRKFLYRPGSREKTPEKELLAVSKLIRKNL